MLTLSLPTPPKYPSVPHPSACEHPAAAPGKPEHPRWPLRPQGTLGEDVPGVGAWVACGGVSSSWGHTRIIQPKEQISPPWGD